MATINYFKNSSCKIQNDGYSDRKFKNQKLEEMNISNINCNLFNDSTNKTDYIQNNDGTYSAKFDGRTIDSVKY